MTVAIIDHGMGNLGSVQNMLRRLGAVSVRTTDPDEIAAADRIVLAGIGGFDGAMGRLEALGIVDVLNDRALNSATPVLGVCLGMQLMAQKSEEGLMGGLGWIEAEVRRFEFPPERKLPVPHMGWQEVDVARPNPLVDPEGQPRFYFSHAYHVVCRDPADVVATATYGDPFVAAVHRRNILGTQFHPEKSHVFGMDVYRRFLSLPT